MDQNGVKVQAANDAVQAIKQLRKEIVAIMSQLLCLAKSKNSKGMLPLCNEMVTKTRVLLNIWEPSLVEEAFEFIENHRTVEESDNFAMVIIASKHKICRIHILIVSANVTIQKDYSTAWRFGFEVTRFGRFCYTYGISTA